MKKEFLPYDAVRNNALKMACRISNVGFIPNVIYVLLRGGAYMGNVISEYFKFIQRRNSPVYYAAVVAHSYTGIREAEEIKVQGWTYPPEALRTGDKILLVDDIFDSGRTINHLAKIILGRGIARKDLKIVVHDYKYFYDKEDQHEIQPDYWCRKHELSLRDEPMWIHYCSHELVGLKLEELEKHYYREAPELKDVLGIMFKKTSGGVYEV